MSCHMFTIVFYIGYFITLKYCEINSNILNSVRPCESRTDFLLGLEQNGRRKKLK